MKACRHYLMLSGCILAAWLLYASLGSLLSRELAGWFGDAVLRMGRGKVAEPVSFIHHRLRELLWLSTLLLLWIGAQGALDRFLRVRGRQSWRWWMHGLAGFLLLNVWVGAAMNTALFWSAVSGGTGVQNLSQFHFKRILLEESTANPRAVLLGSSQTRAEIDEELLNSTLGTNLWTTELHFPGSHAYDLLVVERQILRANPQWVICYLSEGYFYQGSSGETVPNFLEAHDLMGTRQLHPMRYLPGSGVVSGLLGELLPVYRCREAFAQRVLGSTLANMKQTDYDQSLSLNLEERAAAVASGIQITPESDFQKQAFESFIVRCQQAQRQVVLIVGGYNPVLAAQIRPDVRRDMLDFLDHLKRRHSCVTLITQGELVVQDPQDYEDLSHVTPHMQRRFTAALARRLKTLLNHGHAEADVVSNGHGTKRRIEPPPKPEL